MTTSLDRDVDVWTDRDWEGRLCGQPFDGTFSYENTSLERLEGKLGFSR